MPTEHRDIVNAELHEPKGVAAASNDDVCIADGNGLCIWGPALPGDNTIVESMVSASARQILTTSIVDGYYDYYQIDNLGNSADINSDVETNSTTFETIASVRLWVPTNADELNFKGVIQTNNASYTGTVKIINDADTLSTEDMTTTSTSWVIALTYGIGSGASFPEAMDVSSLSGWQVFHLQGKTSNVAGRLRVQHANVQLGTEGVLA